MSRRRKKPDPPADVFRTSAPAIRICLRCSRPTADYYRGVESVTCRTCHETAVLRSTRELLAGDASTSPKVRRVF